MAKAKGRVRQDKHLVDKTVAPDSDPRYEAHRPPTGDQCRTFDVGSHQVFHGVWYQAGRLTDFCLCIQVPVADEWADVMRIDCCHGSVHVHRFDSTGKETLRVLREIYNQEDVEAGFQVASDLIYEQAEVALMGWERGL
jgi:hypothetical protein